MKSTNDNPTPTTLRDELDNLYEAGYNVGDGFKPPLTKDRRLDQATQQIIQLIKSEVNQAQVFRLNSDETADKFVYLHEVHQILDNLIKE